MTPPTDIIADLPDAYTEILVGFEGDLFFTNPDAEADANAIHEFMIALEPVPSPNLVDGQLSADAQQGKTLFQARCAFCHSGTYYTDMQMHDVGTGETTGEELDTPTLIEVWRTAPYLQDGRAATMEEVLTTYNPSNQHGTTSDLSSQQIDDLAEYVLSISAPHRQFAGDFEPDGDVDGYDLDTLTAAWLSQLGDGNWDERCDIAEPANNFIDFDDYAVFAKDWQVGVE
jgi:mono/diheme cytochrome c family protein